MSWHGWKSVFAAKSDAFLDALERAVAVTAQLAELLKAYMTSTDPAQKEQLTAAARELEHAGDAIRAEVLERLQTTLVTPLDREDLNDLSEAIDDIADYTENAVKEMRLYGVEPNRHLVEMAQTLASAVAALGQAVAHLKDDRALSAENARLAKRQENRMESIYRQAIAELGSESDIHYLIKLREVYRHLSNAADRVDAAANVITRIVVKEGG